MQAGELASLTQATRPGAPAARLARMEQHMRERKLRAATLTERLARVDDDHVRDGCFHQSHEWTSRHNMSVFGVAQAAGRDADGAPGMLGSKC